MYAVCVCVFFLPPYLLSISILTSALCPYKVGIWRSLICEPEVIIWGFEPLNIYQLLTQLMIV